MNACKLQCNGNGYNGYGTRAKPNLAQEMHVHKQAATNIERSTELCFDTRSMGTYQTKLNMERRKPQVEGDAMNACNLQCTIYKYAMEWNGYNGYASRAKPNLAQERHVHIQAAANIERSTELCFDVKSMGTYQTKLNMERRKPQMEGDAVNACNLWEPNKQKSWKGHIPEVRDCSAPH